MDANWVWQDGGSVNILLRDTGGSVNSSVQFEFDNSDYNSLSDIGTGGTNAVGTDNYVATVTYFSGSGVLNLDNNGTGDTVLSGLDSTGTEALGQIQVGNDNNILTINAGAGNSYDFNGTIQAIGGGAGQASILKTGAGEQILTGAVNLDGSSSGFVDIYEGTLTFNPDSADTQSIEYLTSTDDSDAGTTPVLKLDNTSAGTGEILEIGLSNVSSAKTFNGNVVLSGADSDHKIKIGTTDYSDEQIITGTITSLSNGMTLVKDGAGRLTLHGDSASTMGANISINDGTLIIGDGSDAGADPGDGTTININKGKLEVAANESIDNTIAGGTNASKKSIVGGDGTIAALTVGSASGEVDVLSPGQGLSSSLTEISGLSNQQVTLGTSSAAEAMGNLTITSLTLNNGAIFDWEISDFNSGANQASFNDEFDVLNFGTLNFGSGAVIDVNIFSVQSNGTAGAVANIGTHSNDNGILFLNGGSHSDINWGAGNTALSNSGWSSASDYFSVEEEAFNYYNGNLMGDWNVWYNGSGDFYLRYTAAPEPSTYIMITGLLMLPGFRMFRKFFKKAKPENCSTDS
jgi:autotransporter-associated beta strand protein